MTKTRKPTKIAKQVKPKPVKDVVKPSPLTLQEIVDMLRKTTSRLRGMSNSILSGKLKANVFNSFMPELDEVIDGLNIAHSRLVESCEFGEIVKVGEMEMQREHYDRYMEVRRRIEQSGKKQLPSIV
jgi:hypothetical protein